MNHVQCYAADVYSITASGVCSITMVEVMFLQVTATQAQNAYRCCHSSRPKVFASWRIRACSNVLQSLYLETILAPSMNSIEVARRTSRAHQSR